MNPNEQLAAIEKIINDAKKKAKEVKRNELDGDFSSVVQSMQIMIIRSRALSAIQKLIEENDVHDVDV